VSFFILNEIVLNNGCFLKILKVV